MATVEALSPQLVNAKPARGLWGDAFARLRKNCLAMVGLIIVILLFLLAIFGPIVAPYSYQAQDLKAVVANGNRPVHPGDAQHILGTDQLGRDLLSRLMDGARISMSVAIVVQIVVLLIGVPIGAMAGWFGGRVDNLLMRFTDVMYAFPDLLFIILLSVAFRETPFGKAMDGLLVVFVAIGLRSGSRWRASYVGNCCVEGDGVRRGRASDRGLRPQDRDPTPAAERDRTGHRSGHPRDPGGHPG